MSPIVRMARPTARFVEITPAQASAWLQKFNPHNRAMSDTTVQRYATAMKRREWLETGDPIRFSWDGNLLDGQHRLRAIVVSGIPHRMLVVRGLNPAVFTVIDTGKVRQGADVLSILGVKNAPTTACATQMVLQWYRMKEIGGYGSARVNNTELVNAWQTRIDTKHMAKVVTIAIRARKAFKSVGILAAIGYLMGPPHLTAFENMVKGIATGEELSNGDPVLTLLREMNKWGTRKPGNRELSALLVKVANARLQERKLTKLVWAIGEEFPTLVGTYTADPTAA